MRIVGGVHPRRALAARRAHHEAVGTDGLEVRPARHDRDVVPGVREARGVVAAHGPGADDRDAHQASGCGNRARQ